MTQCSTTKFIYIYVFLNVCPLHSYNLIRMSNFQKNDFGIDLLGCHYLRGVIVIFPETSG